MMMMLIFIRFFVFVTELLVCILFGIGPISTLKKQELLKWGV